MDLLNYWERLRAGRIAPLRSELDPREFRQALHNSFVLQLTRFGDLRIRLSGMSLNDLMGMELRGMPATALIEPNDRPDFNEILNELVSDPHIAELQLDAGARDPRSPPLARMLLLPLCDDLGEVTRVLGAVSLRRAAQSTPCRFQLRRVKRTRIVSLQDDKSEQHRRAGFAEAKSPFVPPRPSTPEVRPQAIVDQANDPLDPKPSLRSVPTTDPAPGMRPRRSRARDRVHLKLVKDD